MVGGAVSLINHRRSAYVDDDELERAAGAFEIEAESAGDPACHYYAGAAVALRLISENDFKTHADLMRVFKRVAFGEKGSR